MFVTDVAGENRYEKVSFINNKKLSFCDSCDPCYYMQIQPIAHYRKTAVKNLVVVCGKFFNKLVIKVLLRYKFSAFNPTSTIISFI